MSKELNIIEASNMPVGTEFMVRYSGGGVDSSKIVLSSVNEVKLFKWALTCNLATVKETLITATFIPIQQPVSFMEAIKSGKSIKVTHGRFSKSDTYMEIKDMFYFMSKGEADFPIDLIENGKWYIEESED